VDGARIDVVRGSAGKEPTIVLIGQGGGLRAAENQNHRMSFEHNAYDKEAIAHRNRRIVTASSGGTSRSRLRLAM